MVQNITIVKKLVKNTTPRVDMDTALRTAFRIVSIITSRRVKPTKKDKKLFVAFTEGRQWAWNRLEKLYDSGVPEKAWLHLFGTYLALALAGYVSPTYDVPPNTPTFELPDILYRSFELVGCVVTTRSRKCFELDP
jgi:hypothetical protein